MRKPLRGIPTVRLLLLTLVVIANPGFTSGHPEDRREKRPGSVAPELTATKATKRARAWSLDREYRYTWTYDGQKVGETRFKITDLRKVGGTQGVDRYVVESHLDYSREGSSQKVQRSLYFDSRWTAVRYRTQTRLRHSSQIESTQDAQGWFEGDELVGEVIHNGKTGSPVRSTMKFSRGGDLLLPHAVESWSILVARHAGKESIPTTKVAYPGFGRVYTVFFQSRGKQSVTLADGAVVTCRRFAFSSKGQGLSGGLWVDDTGRLVRYRQGPLVIQLTNVAGESTRKKRGESRATGDSPPPHE